MKKIIHIWLCLILTFSMFPTIIFAEDTVSEKDSQQDIIEEGSNIAENNCEKNTEPTQIKDSVFSLVENRLIDGVNITVDGKFEKEGTLSVEKVILDKELSESNVVNSFSFDIKVLDNEGNELQPIDKVNVSFEFVKLDNNLDVEVFHEEEPLEAVIEDNVVTVESDGFSVYTVEFTYNGKQYVLDGDNFIKLSDLLNELNIEGEVTDYSVSDENLFNIYLGTDEGISYEENVEIIDGEGFATTYPINNGDIPYLVSLLPFSTTEWLDVEVNGVSYHIVVTDTYVNPDTNQDLSSRVIVDGDNDNFTQNMPLVNIFIDESIVNKNLYKRADIVEATLLSSNPNIIMVTTAETENYGMVRYQGKLEEGKYNVVEEGDVVSYTVSNAAVYTDSNGNEKTGDVVITYSNLRLVTETGAGQQSFASYPLWLMDTNKVQALSSSQTSMIGMLVDVNCKVIDSETGELVEGNFYYPMVDFDVTRYGHAHATNLYGASNNSNYSEQVELIDGYDGRIWVSDELEARVKTVTRTDTNTGESAENLLMYANNNTYIDYDTFTTGFMTVVDNTSGGINIVMYNSGGRKNTSSAQYGAGMESYVLTGTDVVVNNKIVESTDIGGNIVAVSKEDSSDEQAIATNGIYPPDVNTKKIISAARGQTVVFQMTPNAGYKIKNIYVTSGLNALDGAQDGTLSPIGFSNINLIKKADGVYQYVMENITGEQSIHVEWEKVNILKLKKEVIGDGNSDFTFNITLTKDGKWLDLENVEEKDSEYINVVTLRGGEEKQFSIEEGWTYTITEDEQSGWQNVSSTNASGTFTNSDIESVWVNAQLHSITVEKTTVDDKAGTFTYKIKVWNPDDNTYLDLSESKFGSLQSEGNNEYSFTLNNGGSKVITNIPHGYEYEVYEESQSGWKLVQIDKHSNNEVTVTNGKYKIEIADEDIQNLKVYEDTDIEVYYKKVWNDTTSVEELIVNNTSDNIAASSVYNTGSSTLDSGKLTISDISNVIENISNNFGTIELDVANKEGESSTYTAIATQSVTYRLNMVDLSTITPTVTVGSNFVYNTTSSQYGDAGVIRNGWNKLTSTVVDTPKTLDGTITITYPNAAYYHDDETNSDVYLPVVFTVSGVTIFPRTNYYLRAQDFVSVFNINGGPASYAENLYGNVTVYGLMENVSVYVPNAPAGTQFQFKVSDLGDPFIYPDTFTSTITDADEYNNFDEAITFTSTINETVSDTTTEKIVVVDASTGVSLNVILPGGLDNGYWTVGNIAYATDTVNVNNSHQIVSNPFMLTVENDITNTVLTKENDYYIVELAEGQILTIPDGKTYKIYKLNDSDEWEEYKDSEDYSSSVSNPNSAIVSDVLESDTDITYTNKRDPKDIVIKKIWVDDNNAYNTRPGDLSLTVKYTSELQATDESKASDYEFKLTTTSGSWDKTNDNNNYWIYTFENIPGDAVITDIAEVVPTNYLQENKIINNDTENYKLINILKSKSITVNKTVSGTMADTSKEFNFHLRVYKPSDKSITLVDDQYYLIDNIIMVWKDGHITLVGNENITVGQCEVNSIGYSAANPTGGMIRFTYNGLSYLYQKSTNSGVLYTDDTAWTQDFTLFHGESKEISNIPSLSPYVIEEEDYSSENYTTKINGNSGRLYYYPSLNSDKLFNFENTSNLPIPTSVKCTANLLILLLGVMLVILIRTMRKNV